jgi:hypothetical protein
VSSAPKPIKHLENNEGFGVAGHAVPGIEDLERWPLAAEPLAVTQITGSCGWAGFGGR